MNQPVNTGSSETVVRTASCLNKCVQWSLPLTCLLVCAPRLFAQLDPLATMSDTSPTNSRECTIVFKQLSNVDSQCPHTVENPLDLELLQLAFQSLRFSDPNDRIETTIQIPASIRDAATSWIQKVWKAHERIVPGLPMESMSSESLESQLNSITKLAKDPRPFTPPAALLPPISFQIFIHSAPDANNDSSNSTMAAQRLIVVPSPSPLSVKSMRLRLSLPAALIDNSGAKSTEFFQIRVTGLPGFQDAFKKHEQHVFPFTKDYYEVLAEGSESQIRDFNSKLLEKWQKFQTEFGKWPAITSNFEIDMEQAKRESGNSYPSFSDDREDSFDPYNDKIKKPTGKRPTKFTEQVGKKVDTLLFKSLFQSVSRFLAGTSRPVQELIEAEKGFRFLRREMVGGQPKLIEAYFAKRAVLAIDSTAIYLIDGKTALDVTFPKVTSLGIADDLLAIGRPQYFYADSRYSEEDSNKPLTQQLFLQTIRFLNTFNPETQQLSFPSPPNNPTVYPGERLTVYDVATGMLDELGGNTVQDSIAKNQLKAVISLLESGNDRLLRQFPSSIVDAAKKIVEVAEEAPIYLNSQAKQAVWRDKVNSPEFQNNPEYRRYLERKSAWEAECQKLQADWDNGQASRNEKWNIKRDAMIAYVRSLEMLINKAKTIQEAENRLNTLPRVNALKQATEPGEARPVCLVPSLVSAAKQGGKEERESQTSNREYIK